MSEAYPAVGNIARLTGEFRNSAKALTDPTSVSVMIKPPHGAAMTVVPTRLSTGVYYYDLELTQPNTWYYRFVGTGYVKAQSTDAPLYVIAGQF